MRLSRRYAFGTDRDEFSHHGAVVFTMRDTPEHAEWLNTLTDDVLRELWCAVVGHGWQPIVTSEPIYRFADPDAASEEDENYSDGDVL